MTKCGRQIPPQELQVPEVVERLEAPLAQTHSTVSPRWTVIVAGTKYPAELMVTD